MATIVVLKVTGKHYALVGTGYSFFKDSRPSFLGGVLFPHQEEGESMCAAISDEYGVIRWVQTNEIRVIMIDGVRIGEILEPYLNSRLSSNRESDPLGDCCPTCGIGVSVQDKECPSCGLRLMD